MPGRKTFPNHLAFTVCLPLPVFMSPSPHSFSHSSYPHGQIKLISLHLYGSTVISWHWLLWNSLNWVLDAFWQENVVPGLVGLVLAAPPGTNSQWVPRYPCSIPPGKNVFGTCHFWSSSCFPEPVNGQYQDSPVTGFPINLKKLYHRFIGIKRIKLIHLLTGEAWLLYLKF